MSFYTKREYQLLKAIKITKAKYDYLFSIKEHSLFANICFRFIESNKCAFCILAIGCCDNCNNLVREVCSIIDSYWLQPIFVQNKINTVLEVLYDSITQKHKLS